MLILRCSVLLLALLSGFCRADLPLVTVGYYDFPPSIYTTPDGRTEGPLRDLLTRMLQRGGYTAEFRSMPIARLYNELREGRVDLWAGAPNKQELRGHVLESDRPLAEVRLNLYHRPDTPAPRVPEDLAGKVMIMLSGYSYWPHTRELLLDPDREIIQLRTHHRASALELLRRQRGDYLLDYQLPIEQLLEEAGRPPLPYVTVESLPIRLIVSRKSANAPLLLQRLDEVFDRMQADGEDMQLP
ncbi:substrate-binding periplasmic protein [Pseudomonas subflava]|uniref:substrate-binding periplasmic protein n=1 Tax=Pseudomonas subflava TaxID=2952933 RepID=UPI00207A18D8|nr:transporter substrate-binding domain-containing protein [Pseudomonas subflava]